MFLSLPDFIIISILQSSARHRLNIMCHILPCRGLLVAFIFCQLPFANRHFTRGWLKGPILHLPSHGLHSKTLSPSVIGYSTGKASQLPLTIIIITQVLEPESLTQADCVIAGVNPQHVWDVSNVRGSLLPLTFQNNKKMFRPWERIESKNFCFRRKT